MIYRNMQYISDESGNKTAVIVPYKKWLVLNKENKRLKQLVLIKKGLKDAFIEFEEVKVKEKEAAQE